MSITMTKTQLIETLRSKRAAWDSVLAEVPHDLMTEPGVAGIWSVKDLIAHLAYHERWYAERLHEQLRGDSYTPSELDRLGFDERNQQVYLQNQSKPLADVLAESRQAFQRLMEGVEAHKEAFLIEPQQLEGMPVPVAIWTMLRGDIYEHYALHIPSIKDWMAARKKLM